MIDHTRKLIFIHIARTGGSSIEHALVKEDWFQIDPKTKHISASQARQLYGEAAWNEYRKFAVVRNPWDRLVSMWATKWWHQAAGIDPDCQFSTFIRHLKPHPYERYDSLFYHQILDEELDFVLRFESLAGDFSNMLGELNIDVVTLPHKELRRRKPYHDMYSNETRDLVAKKFACDIKEYSYTY